MCRARDVFIFSIYWKKKFCTAIEREGGPAGCSGERESMNDVRQEEEGQSRGEGVSEEACTPKPATSPVSSSKQELTDLAVKFLNNPRVMSHPLEAKKAFLRKKGKLI